MTRVPGWKPALLIVAVYLTLAHRISTRTLAFSSGV